MTWKCQCDCGNVKNIRTDALGVATLSCGCLNSDIVRSMKPSRQLYSDSDSRPHSKYNKLYNAWKHMRARCNNKKGKEYPNWGGRGIKVCKEWDESYEEFKQWSLKNGFDCNANVRSMTIDRINVNKNYEPSNCRWVDMTIQANNKTNNVFVEVNGEHLTLGQCARKYNIPYPRLAHRHLMGVRGNDLIAAKNTNFKKEGKI